MSYADTISISGRVKCEQYVLGPASAAATTTLMAVPKAVRGEREWKGEVWWGWIVRGLGLGEEVVLRGRERGDVRFMEGVLRDDVLSKDE